MKPIVAMSHAIDHVTLQKKILYKLKTLIKIGIAAKEISDDVKKNVLSASARITTLPQFFTRYWNHPTAFDPQPLETWQYMRNNKQFRTMISEALRINIEGTYFCSTGIDQTRLIVQEGIKDEHLNSLGRLINASSDSMSHATLIYTLLQLFPDFFLAMRPCTLHAPIFYSAFAQLARPCGFRGTYLGIL
jgi:hypothetical protein